MVKNYWTYHNANIKGFPENSIIILWINEFKEFDTRVITEKGNSQSGFDGVLQDTCSIQSSLDEGIDPIDKKEDIFGKMKEN